LVYSKKETGRHTDPEEVNQLLADKLASLWSNWEIGDWRLVLSISKSPISNFSSKRNNYAIWPEQIRIGLTQFEDLTGFRKQLQATITPYSIDFHQCWTLWKPVRSDHITNLFQE
jgi:hypothetical protein